MRLFLDTNILIDFVSARQPFSEAAAVLFQLADDGEVALVLSDLSIVNAVYILGRLGFPLQDIYDVLTEICEMVTLTETGPKVIRACLQARSKDFEDNVQYLSAMNAGADYVITRNKKDFAPFDEGKVLTPLEFLDMMNIVL